MYREWFSRNFQCITLVDSRKQLGEMGKRGTMTLILKMEKLRLRDMTRFPQGEDQNAASVSTNPASRFPSGDLEAA